MTINYGHDSDTGRFIIDALPPWSIIEQPAQDIVTNALSNFKEKSIIVTEKFDTTFLDDRIKIGIAEGNYTYNETYPIISQRDTLDDSTFEHEELVATGIQYVKKYISWNDVQPTISHLENSDGDPTNSSAYNWDLWGEAPGEYDDIQIAIDNGLKVILVIECNQRNSTFVTEDEHGNYPIGFFGLNSGIQAYRLFLKAIATRYGISNIYAWEVVDKADINWKGAISGVTSYGQLVAETKIYLNTLSSPSPNRLAVSLSTGQLDAQNFFFNISTSQGILERARTVIGDLLFDILDIHLEEVVDLVDPQRSQFEHIMTFAPIKPTSSLKFWSTELKISSTIQKVEGINTFGGTDQSQAEDIVKVMIDRFADGWDLVLLSYLFDNNSNEGIVDANSVPYPGIIKKTSYDHFQTFSNIVNGSVYESYAEYDSSGNILKSFRFRALGRRLFFSYGDTSTYDFPDFNWDFAVGGYLTGPKSSLTKYTQHFVINYSSDDIYFIEQYEPNVDKPNYLNVTRNTDNLRLQWDPAEGSDLYRIYKAIDGSTLAFVGNTNNTYYEDLEVDEETTYNYYVQGVEVTGEGVITFSGTADDDQGISNSGLDKVEILITKGTQTDVVNAELIEPATAPRQWTYDWTPTEDGEYIIEVRATDLAGNVQEPPYSKRNVVIDIIGPNIYVDSPVDYFPTNDTVEIIGRASDDHAGVKAVRVWIDGVEYSVTGVEDWSLLYTPTTDGEHLIEIEAEDYATNISYTVWHIITDTTRPFLQAYLLEGSILRNRDVTLKIIATDEGKISGYYISESPELPALEDAGWINITPTVNLNIEHPYYFEPLEEEKQ